MAEHTLKGFVGLLTRRGEVHKTVTVDFTGSYKALLSEGGVPMGFDKAIFGEDDAIIHRIKVISYGNCAPFDINLRFMSDGKPMPFLNTAVHKSDNAGESSAFHMSAQSSGRPNSVIVNINKLTMVDACLLKKYPPGTTLASVLSAVQYVNGQHLVPTRSPIIAELLHKGGPAAKNIRNQVLTPVTVVNGRFYQVPPEDYQTGVKLVTDRLNASPHVKWSELKLVAFGVIRDPTARADEIKTAGDSHATVSIELAISCRPISCVKSVKKVAKGSSSEGSSSESESESESESASGSESAKSSGSE